MDNKKELDQLYEELKVIDEKLKTEAIYTRKYQSLLNKKKRILENIDSQIKVNIKEKEKEIAILNYINKVEIVSNMVNDTTKEIDLKIKDYEDMISDSASDEIMCKEYNKLIIKLLEQKLDTLAVGNLIINSKTKSN